MIELHTNHGVIKIALFADESLKTVQNFLNYVRTGTATARSSTG
ncbi:peptidylprolyl isomerase [Streptomyces sp. DSM 40473]|uniref:Peptidylprolyl isomerase n=1 Tax=Streptomyces hesseae TaxID=3075519 RepID=A0ABU2SHC6_9ACTN|nr:peptidylprolyl isomerase [Streptomyces sp. DSM 40473]MDT0447784.1 peptidylprolyl isomerase [Streptomyces sp. DSM 40473]